MLAKTHPMGWNSRNTFAKDVNEEIVLGAVDQDFFRTEVTSHGCRIFVAEFADQ